MKKIVRLLSAVSFAIIFSACAATEGVFKEEYKNPEDPNTQIRLTKIASSSDTLIDYVNNVFDEALLKEVKATRYGDYATSVQLPFSRGWVSNTDLQKRENYVDKVVKIYCATKYKAYMTKSKELHTYPFNREDSGRVLFCLQETNPLFGFVDKERGILEWQSDYTYSYYLKYSERKDILKDISSSLADIAKKSTSLLDYSSKIFKDDFLKNYTKQKDTASIEINYRSVDYSKRIEYAFGIYCKEKYSAEHTNDFFCGLEIPAPFVNYSLVFMDMKGALYTERKDIAEQIRIAKKDIAERIHIAKNAVVNYSAIKPQYRITEEYTISEEYTNLGVKKVSVTIKVNNASDAPFLYELLSFRTFNTGGKQFAVTYPTTDDKIWLKNKNNCPRVKDAVVVNPGETCNLEVPITVSGFPFSLSPFNIRFADNKIIPVNVNTIYSLSKEHIDSGVAKSLERFDSVAKRLGLDIR